MHPAIALGATAGFDRWVEFVLLVLVLLAFDLFVVHRKAHAIPLRAAVGWSVFWIGLAFAFNGWVWWEYGEGPAKDFLTAYVVEKALSVDNLFVFLTIFAFFQVPATLRHKVLFYGIVGALVMRAAFILLGAELLHRFEPMFYVFGGFLILTGARLLTKGEEDPDPSRSLAYRIGKRLLPLVPEYHGDRFFVRRDGRWFGTTLLLVLFVVEGTDVMFAVDSVPAVLAITQDLFIVYTSNVFAILGLRALYFVIERGLESIPGLHVGLALVLAFVGLKMVAIPHDFHVRSDVSLGIIVLLLLGSWLVTRTLRARESG